MGNQFRGFAWMNKLTLFNACGQRIHGVKLFQGNEDGRFVDKRGNVYDHLWYGHSNDCFLDADKFGVCVHTDCLEFFDKALRDEIPNATHKHTPKFAEKLKRVHNFHTYAVNHAKTNGARLGKNHTGLINSQYLTLMESANMYNFYMNEIYENHHNNVKIKDYDPKTKYPELPDHKPDCKEATDIICFEISQHYLVPPGENMSPKLRKTILEFNLYEIA